MSGFKRRLANIDSGKLEDFLSDAATSTAEHSEQMPDEEEEAQIKSVNDTRLARSINLRLTEREIRQLQYISKHAGISMNGFIRLAIKAHLPKAMAVAKKRKKEHLL